MSKNQYSQALDRLNKIHEAQVIQGIELDRAKNEAYEVYVKQLKKSSKMKIINEWVSKLESSNQLTSVEHDDNFHAFIHVELDLLVDSKNDLEREFLGRFFDEYHCISVDYKYNCISHSLGPSIVLNEYGDLYDQDSCEFIASKQDWVDESGEPDYALAYELVEAWMAKNEYYPPILKCDQYKNAYYLDLKKLAGK